MTAIAPTKTAYFAIRLLELRLCRRLTVKQLAAKTLGQVKPRRIIKIEQGVCRPRFADAIELARALETSLDSFVPDDE